MNRRHILVADLLLGAGPALAHNEGARGSNGGVIGNVGSTHVKVLARDGGMRIWVLDDADRPVSAAGASGSVIVQSGGQQRTVRLERGEGGAFSSAAVTSAR